MLTALLRYVPYLALILALLFFTRLGLWQVQRADEKAQWIAELEQAKGAAAEVLVAKPKALANGSYKRVTLTGSWHPSKSFLWDSQVVDGRVGYVLLTPLQLQDGSWLLTNRGWFEGNPDRSVKPELYTPTKPQRLSGLLRPLPRPALAMLETLAGGWPKVIQQLDPAAMSAAFGVELADLVVVLDADQQGVYRVQQAIGTMPPEKHMGYAVQWFALALTAAVLLVVIWRRRVVAARRKD